MWITGRDDLDLAPDLARSLTEEIERASFGERAKALLHKLDKVQVELGVPGAKVGVELASSGQHAAAIESTVEDAGRFARNHDHGGLAVFVDEFQEARLADRRSLLIALQHFDGSPDGCPVAIIGAGLPSVLAAVPDAASFGERSEFVEVGLLTDVAVAEALRLPAQDLQVNWSDPAIDEAIAIAQGYPHHVQLLGQGAWEAARPEAGDRIEVGHVRQGAEYAENRMATVFRSRVAKATDEQRRFIHAMAALGDGAVARSSIADRLGIASTALSRPRQELIDRGLIESAGHGNLRFTIPGFSSYLRDQAVIEADSDDPTAGGPASLARRAASPLTAPPSPSSPRQSRAGKDRKAPSVQRGRTPGRSSSNGLDT